MRRARDIRALEKYIDKIADAKPLIPGRIGELTCQIDGRKLKLFEEMSRITLDHIYDTYECPECGCTYEVEDKINDYCG